jgi:hypothetical protein
MNSFASIMILGIFLQAIAIASPNIATTGPFEITFDLNTSKNLINQQEGPDKRKVSDDLSIVSYGLEIIDSDTPDDAAKAKISINEYSSPIPESLKYRAEQAARFFHIVDKMATIDYRTIDGNPGYVVKGTNKNGRIEYSSGYRIGEQIEVIIAGALPELKGLLDTIHIEKR